MSGSQPAQEEGIEQSNACLPGPGFIELFGDGSGEAPERRFEIDHAIGKRVHRNTEDHVSTDRGEVDLHPLLADARLHDRV